MNRYCFGYFLLKIDGCYLIMGGGEGEIKWVKAHSFGPSLKSALRPPPSARAESANFRPFYVKRADFSPLPPATKKRRKLVQIRPRCRHLATTKRRKVVKIRPYGGRWVGGPSPPSFCLNLILSSNLNKYGKIWKNIAKIGSLIDCKSLFLYVMIQVLQFVSNSQLCH